MSTVTARGAGSGGVVDVARIGTALLRRPRDLPRYARQGLRRTSPMDLALPWFSYGAIDALAALVRPEWIVAEYGSGGSTLFFASHAARVFTAEHDAGWASRVETESKRSGLTNVEVRSPSADFSTAEHLLASPYAHAFDDLAPDLVVIDCWTDGSDRDELRPALFRHAERNLRPRVIVVDDSYRYPHLRRETTAARVVTFTGVDPSRRRVTSTDLFLYDKAREA